MLRTSFALGILLLLFAGSQLRADVASARLAMENPDNPLLALITSTGVIYIEMLPAEAPSNVAHFIDLVEGEVAINDPVSGRNLSPRFFDGSYFHRVLPGFVIQAGSPVLHPLRGAGSPLPDEINATGLGLNLEPVMDELGRFNPRLNISDQQDLQKQILSPLYQRMNIDSAGELADRQGEVVSRLQEMTMQQAYETRGYRFRDNLSTRAINRGTVALANSGPNLNGPEFFIALQDAPWLSGRHTVIGHVVEGMEIADRIGRAAVNPEEAPNNVTSIYAIRRVE